MLLQNRDGLRRLRLGLGGGAQESIECLHCRNGGRRRCWRQRSGGSVATGSRQVVKGDAQFRCQARDRFEAGRRFLPGLQTYEVIRRHAGAAG